MPTDPVRRRDYMNRAGLSEAKLAQTVGKITVDPKNARASEASPKEIAGTAQEIKEFLEEAAVITAMYNAAAKASKRDAREVVDRTELDEDTTRLNEMFADEYLLTDPLGTVVDKAGVIDNILSGKIRYHTFGRGGYETTENVLQVHNQAAVLIGEFKMKATQLARHRESGEVKRIPRSGIFRSTNAYVHRDERWQLTATQLVRVPEAEREWAFIDD